MGSLFSVINFLKYNVWLAFVVVGLIYLSVGGIFHYYADSALDIDVHDTYFVVSLFHVFLIMSVNSLMIAAVYSLIGHFKKTAVLWMSILNLLVVLILFGIAIIMFAFPISNGRDDSGTHYLANIFVTFFILSPVLALLNVGISITRNKN